MYISAPPLPIYPLRAVPLSRRRTVVTAHIEILHFVESFGLNHCSFLTLTCGKGQNMDSAQRILNNASRRFLKDLFPAWITMVEFDSYDRPHFHLLVTTRHDFRSGFNFDHYNRMKQIGKRAYDERRPLTTAEKQERGVLARNLTTDPMLKALWKQLRKKLPGFGFSKSRPAELIPIEKNATAIAFYLTKQFHSPHLLRFVPKGARLFRTSADCPRLVSRVTDLVIDTPGRRKYLARRERICSLLGCPTDEAMKRHYSPRWQFRCLQLSMALDDRYPDTPIPWDSPEVLELTEEIMANGYVRPDPIDPYDYLLPANSRQAA